MRPRNIDGTFYKDFDPRAGENFEHAPGFHEGSSWNYTFYVPHDVDGLIKLMGGKRTFVDKLQMVFDKGLYDPANEPDIAYPYLFSRVKGEEWRTQREVKRLLEKHYTTKPDGIPGNDDTGTMSAWAIFSMMGLYPDCPAEPLYTLTSPAFDRVVVNSPFGEVVISKSGKGDYIRTINMGGKAINRYRISHDELLKNKGVSFEMRSNASNH